MKRIVFCLLIILSSLTYPREKNSYFKLHPKIKAFVTLLKNDAYRLVHNVEMPNGILIVQDDYTNPKNMAQWMASELEANFFEFSLSSLAAIRKEHGASAITELFLASEQLAQSKNKRSILFIENLDEFNTDEAIAIREEIVAYFDKVERNGKTFLVASCTNTALVDSTLKAEGCFSCLVDNQIIKRNVSKKLPMVTDHLPHRLQMILKLLKNQETYKKQFNLTLPRGILLTGKPGTGKTEFARHIAQELEGFFVLCSSTQFVTQWQGSGEQEIRKIFESAKAHAELSGKVVVVFLDEIDAIASLRTNNGVANMGYEKALNELLIQMDGFEQDSNILVIGATNIPDKLDPAIKRSGRFDYIVEIPEPSFTARKKLFKHFLDQFTAVDDNIKLDQLANKELTPADIKNIVNQAAHEAAFVDAPKITQKLLERALHHVLSQKKGSNKTQQGSTWHDLVTRHGRQENQKPKKAAGSP